MKLKPSRAVAAAQGPFLTSDYQARKIRSFLCVTNYRQLHSTQPRRGSFPTGPQLAAPVGTHDRGHGPGRLTALRSAATATDKVILESMEQSAILLE